VGELYGRKEREECKVWGGPRQPFYYGGVIESDCAWGGSAACPATTLGLLCSGLGWAKVRENWLQLSSSLGAFRFPPFLFPLRKKLGAYFTLLRCLGAWMLGSLPAPVGVH
jgi:hypothetical protein